MAERFRSRCVVLPPYGPFSFFAPLRLKRGDSAHFENHWFIPLQVYV